MLHLPTKFDVSLKGVVVLEMLSVSRSQASFLWDVKENVIEFASLRPYKALSNSLCFNIFAPVLVDVRKGKQRVHWSVRSNLLPLSIIYARRA